MSSYNCQACSKPMVEWVEVCVDCASKLEEPAPSASANMPSMPVCPGMEMCDNFGSCADCLRHPSLRDKWSAKPAYIG